MSLTIKANLIRQHVIRMLLEAGSGHTAGSLGMVDIFTALYFHILNHDPKKPDWNQRDRLILSNGHICPALYAAMAESGYFPVSELMTLRKLGSRLQGHPHRASLPGIENTSGPLGSGISQAAGLALAGKMDKAKWQVICLTSDGEHDEGNTWEGVMLAGKYKLNNLVALMDRNNIQIDGFTEDVMPLNDIKAKYEAFNWHVLEIDGHNMNEIIKAFDKARTILDKPTIIIANTIPGKGVSFMENKYQWHGKAPNQEEAEKALAELKSK
ncbi:transketolase [Candidatus Daviesbacteria bacterium]|nr:transketolase [Candidatus Daviesbacteria bacterium]